MSTVPKTRWLALLLAAACASCANDDPVAAQLAFNEFGASGDDFAELYNTGAASVDISGYGVTDSRTDGFPKLSHVVRFPAGTTVPAGGRVLVMFDGACPASTTPYVCARGSAGGISGSRGENVHLVDPENLVVATAHYPANAAPSGFTYGRFPDGTGAFGPTRRTPGAANGR